MLEILIRLFASTNMTQQVYLIIYGQKCLLRKYYPPVIKYSHYKFMGLTIEIYKSRIHMRGSYWSIFVMRDQIISFTEKRDSRKYSS